MTGYVSESLLNQNSPLIKDRNIDVGYRGRKLGFWYGGLTYEKWDIVNKWNHYTLNENLRNDISYKEDDRIYGQNWLEFIKKCKVHLGVESGASVMDFTGEIERTVSKHMQKYPDDDFFKVRNLYFKELDGLYKLNQISPRVFEAIALKTGLVLYEGEYSNILQPWRHYIPLKKDFSNIKEVISCIKDDDYLQNMVDLTYQEIGLNSQYSYKNFIENFDSYINEEFILRKKIKIDNYYNLDQFKKLVSQLTFKEKSRKMIRFFYRGLFRSLVNKLLVNVTG